MTTDSERESLLKILVATDNHLGVWEKDDLRKDDSFITFEEIFKIAVEQKVDFVLLGGDLFHDNKPSRNTLMRAMDILSKYCLSDEPVSFQVISNQAENFVSGKVNYENPNFNVGLPVFTIHGNHDDPTGGDNLSAVDVLSTCNLVNYFGKAALKGSSLGRVKISPVLLQKGSTRVGLYGLGNVRDERLARMFQTPGSVEWVRPANSEEFPISNWFNIFVLHQNRVMHTQSTKNSIKESYLPRFLDLVVWGHEHECLPEPKETASEAGFSVVQPGSSVATALSEGESKKKHVLILEILGEQWRSVKRALETVRPFLYDQVVLADRIELDPEDSESVASFLENKVQSMINQATRGRARIDDRPAQLPLIRLKVDYTGFTTINSQRFGQKFVGKVANPHEVLHFHKAAVRRVKPEGQSEQQEVAAQPPDENQIEELIAEHLVDNLSILPEVDLANALHDFVEKDEKQALSACVTTALQATQKAALPQAAGNDDEVEELLHKHAEERRQKAQDNVASVARPNRTAASSLPAPRAEAEAGPSSARPPLARKRRNADDDDEEAARLLASQARSNRPGRGGAVAAAGRGRGNRQATLGKAMARGTRAASSSGAAAGNLDSVLHTAASHETTTQRSAVSRRTPAATPTRGSSRAASARAKQALAQNAEDDQDDGSGSEFRGGDAVEDSDEDKDVDMDDPTDEDEPRPARKRTAAAPAAMRARRLAQRLRSLSREPSPQSEVQDGSAAAPILVDSDDDVLPPQAAPTQRRRMGRLLASSVGSQARGRSAVNARAWGGVRH